MSSRPVTKIDQKEYLKKYLSGGKDKKKKKRDKKQKNAEKVKIIDDDINHMDNGLQIDEELLLTGDDAPQIVGEYIQELDCESKVQKWKSFGVKEELIDERISNNDEDIWGSKNDDRNISNLRKQSPDNSPPRRKDRNRPSPYYSPTRRQQQMLDRSITRKSQDKRSPDRTYRRERLKSLDHSPSRRKDGRHSPYRSALGQSKDLIDQSPIRRRESPHRKKDSDKAPASKRKYVSDKERKRFSNKTTSTQKRYSDESSPRRGRDSVKCDRKRSLKQSPLRKERTQSPDQSPLRRRNDSIVSPRWDKDWISTRRERRRDSDQSPPRKSKNSPSRSRKISPINKDRKSPIRGSQNSPFAYIKPEKAMTLPPRHSKVKRESLSPPAPHVLKLSRWERQEPEKSLSPPPTHKHKASKTLEGKKAGLQDAVGLQKEILERRKQEDVLFEKLSSDISVRNAEIRVRSTGRQGRKAREAKEEDPAERRRKEAHEEKKKQLYDRWGKGLKQIEDYKNRLAEQEHESNKPLARYSNDEDLERHLKELERSDDPMLEYMRQKRKDKEKLTGKPQVPIYIGSFPENRFAIRPGYRWDGVNRSNGYEKKYFDVQNEKRARQDEAYKYSVEDM